MNDAAIAAVIAEIAPLIVGRAPGQVFQLDAATLVIDFRLRDHRTLLVSVNPSLPRIHLLNRRIREMESLTIPLGQFALTLRKQISGSRLVSITKDPDDRIVRLEFSGRDDTNRPMHSTIIAQLTGRSANLFLLSPDGVIESRLRATHIPGQTMGESYQPPTPGNWKRTKSETELLTLIESGQFPSPSEAADAYYQSLNREKEFDQRAAAMRRQLKIEVVRQKKLLKKLEDDLAGHAEGEHHKRIGDLLLANISTAKRSGTRVSLIDYFDSNSPPVEVELEEKSTLPEEASRRFELYSRSKRAVGQIKSRMETVRREIAALTSKQQELDRIMAVRDEAALEPLSEPPAVAGGSVGSLMGGQKHKRAARVPGTRRYMSSDGFEILVGRAAKDNDHLTFKVARPNDLWLHSADYPGSHVVVRNPTRTEVPHRTIIEAAQLAAYYSRANKNPKVDVHYTQRKFLAKPKGAAAGLVRMSRFRNITVEPRESTTRR